MSFVQFWDYTESSSNEDFIESYVKVSSSSQHPGGTTQCKIIIDEVEKPDIDLDFHERAEGSTATVKTIRFYFGTTEQLSGFRDALRVWQDVVDLELKRRLTS